VQLHPGFGFDDAAAIGPYLHDLGVSHFYSSPYLQPARGSMHGYDVVDHSHVNVELGGEEGHARFCAALGEAGLGQVLDIVPNHMAITGRDNAWWWDVLENGPSSVYASYFDVDWDPPESKLRNTVLLPILGDHYGRVLEAGELVLRRDRGSFTVSYFENVQPIAPRSLDTLLEAAAQQLDEDDPGRDELESVATAFGRLPPSWATDRESVRERHRDKEVLRARLAALCDVHASVRDSIDAEVARVNGDVDALDRLLERQNYRLAFWRTGGQELDYRRFFDITTLIGLRVEDEQVFIDSHQLVLRWLEDGVIDGVRIDHPDGLLDPAQYLARLRGAAPHAWIVVEKILEPGEPLRSWPVAGTTGYDFLNLVGGLFVDPAGEDELTKAYAAFTSEPVDYDGVVEETERIAIRSVLAADLNRVTDLLVRVCEGNRRYRDYTRRELRDALAEVLASYPVYRTYVAAERGEVHDLDLAYVLEAIERARVRRPDLDAELLEFLQSVLTLEVDGQREHELAMRVQQVTGPVMAKGVEDTAFYRYHRLTSLNEVGGDPGRFGVSVDRFHRACVEAYDAWPHSMLALSTHDTKRSEDVRARVSLLSEMPAEWIATVDRWASVNERHHAEGWSDTNAEWLYYQTLIGAWPLSPERAVAYMEKAAKEAKVHTSWMDPVPDYDDGLRHFVEATLADPQFIDEIEAFVAPLVGPGRVNAMSQKLVQLTAPGVPDLYQGTELWDLSLVDPDNRRPVDFDVRRRLLAELPSLSLEDVLARSDEGLPKLLVVHAALRARTAIGALGPYHPVAAPERVIAFARGDQLVTVAPRLVLHGRPEGTVDLPPGRWHNAISGEELDGGERDAEELFARFPVALLVRP
jgi:(1->4)-alpha-D-glucan 1-alpha-D-glucosylmutase